MFSSSRDSLNRAKEEKISEVRNLDSEIGEHRQKREKQLGEEFTQMRSRIVSAIRKELDAICKAQGFDVVIDSSALGISQVKFLLDAGGLPDLTDLVRAKADR